ncbi:hypothetical protein E2C01_032115 [Portunus trituberculatus]|uniref:Uncharacterized protein n=1 Tax=Portunus trituberculatus TaxID=210409 RepID=A0A5B7F1X8_PORTR|nr:hypothetical protein [Portunus trituberculatus]
MYSMRTGCVNPRFRRFRFRKKNKKCTSPCLILSPLLCDQHTEIGL